MGDGGGGGGSMDSGSSFVVDQVISVGKLELETGF